MLSNMKISTKLLLVSLSVSVLIICGFIANNVWIRELGSGFRTFVEQDQVLSASLDDMHIQALQSEQATRNILLNPVDEKAVKNYRKSVEEFDSALQKARTVSVDDSAIKAELEKLAQLWQQCNVLKEKVQTLAREGKRDEATVLLLRNETPVWRGMKENILTLQGKAGKRLDDHKKSVETFITSVTIKSSLIALCIVGAVVLMLFRFSLKMRRTITGLSSQIRSISEGNIDLTRRIEYRENDEFGELTQWLNSLIERLHDIIDRVSNDTVLVASTATNILGNAQFVATASHDAAQQAATVATAGEEMAATSHDIAHNCLAAASASQDSSEKAQFGSGVVQESVQIMSRIADQVGVAAKAIDELGSQSNKIGEIVGTIEDIADQTNLLALNAAIEAARAGDQGRGFAVVADEVRALAERTTRATREIALMIKTIQQHTKEAVDTMEHGVREVQKGTEEAQRSGESLQDIMEQINCVSLQISQIATAAEEQTATTSEISSNIHQLDSTMEKTAENARESMNEAVQLGALADDLQHLIKSFRTRSSDVLILDIAKNDHRLFVNRIQSSIQGSLKLDAAEVADHHQCRLGKWYDSAGKQLFGHLHSFRAIDGPHERFHALGKEAVAAANAGKMDKALEIGAQIEDLSHEIIDGLSTIKNEAQVAS
jgi:methyl-accepting chemotaxis protein